MIKKGSYRTYEEWKLSKTFHHVQITEPVLTVPMRNGNTISLTFAVSTILRSYRTYEEWKQHSCVFIISLSFQFLPYL